MTIFSDLKQAEEFLFKTLGTSLRIATPLGLGKPNQLLNRIYQRAKNQPEVSLTLFTALSLDIPSPKTDLEARFVKPFFARHFGDDYPQLEYLKDLKKNSVPANIMLHEFYFQAGSMLNNRHAQANYISLNYTHVAQSIFDMGINCVAQLVARSKDGQKFSLSCNPDLTLDVSDLYNRHKKPLLLIGVVHPDLPYLGGDAEVSPDFFDAIVDSREVTHQLFATPKAPVDDIDHVIGLHASRLVVDDGTLQIGIGSLSDALTSATILRQKNNSVYKDILSNLDKSFVRPEQDKVSDQVFHQGLYGTSEMLMDGFMHLRNAGVLKRTVFDHEEKAQRYLHGAFFLGSKSFYQWLGSLAGEDYNGLSMTRVSKVNDLYDEHELALRRQRKNARFFNTCMQVSLLGAAASETLENGNVVSGVGGQYNFVAMSHELPDSYSVLMMKSTRVVKGKRRSNVVWSPAHLTISRHLRDVVITEYGIAFLKGQSDSECIKRLLAITDSEFQEPLLQQAKAANKIELSWQIPKAALGNSPARIQEFSRFAKAKGLFLNFPFGSDFSDTEINLQSALLNLKGENRRELLKSLINGFTVPADHYKAELERMNLLNPQGIKEKIFQKVLLGSLKAKIP